MKPTLFSIAFAAFALIVIVTLDGSLKEYSEAVRYENRLEAAVRAGTDAATALLHPKGYETAYTNEEIRSICEVFEDTFYASFGGDHLPSDKGKKLLLGKLLSSMELILISEKECYICTKADESEEYEISIDPDKAEFHLNYILLGYDEALGRRAVSPPGFVALFHGKPVLGVNYYEVEVSSDARQIVSSP